MVYEFLLRECKTNPDYESDFEIGLISRTCDTDFWESLSELLDCFRICDECGKPMIEGFVVDGCCTYCSKDCLHKHISEEEYNNLYNDGDGETYWTTWYEDSNTYKYDSLKAPSYDKEAF